MIKIGQSVKFTKGTIEQYKNIPSIMEIINDIQNQGAMTVTNIEYYDAYLRVQINDSYYFNYDELELV